MFVTGAAGFVGSWLSEALCRRGARVTALVWPGGDEEARWRPRDVDGVEVVTGCVEDAHAIERILRHAHADSIFHLAAINVNVGSEISPLAVFETNVRGTWSVLEACRVTPGVERVVVASSREAEDAASVGPSDAAQPRRKRHPYQASKIAAELVAQAYCDTYGLPVVISRSDNVYGGRDMNWHRLIPGTVRSLLNGDAPVLRSDGSLARDYVHIDDMINAYLLLAARAADPCVRGEVFHFATGTSTSALEIVAHLCELAGRPGVKPVIQGRSSGERVDHARSTDRERDLLGWTSRVDIQEGLRSTLDWYREYFGTTAAGGRA